MNNVPELLKVKTKDDELKYTNYKTEKHDHEKFLKTLKIDNSYYKEYINLLKKKENIYDRLRNFF